MPVGRRSRPQRPCGAPQQPALPLLTSHLLGQGGGLFTECLPDHLSVHGAASLRGVEPVAQAPALRLGRGPPQQVRVESWPGSGAGEWPSQGRHHADSPLTPITLCSAPQVSNQPTQNSMIKMGLCL